MAKNTLVDFFKSVRKDTLIVAAITIVVGLLIVFGAFGLLCKILGIIAFAAGIVFLGLYIISVTKKPRTPYYLVLAFIMIIVGAVFFLKSSTIASLLSTIIASLILIDGAIKFDDSISLLQFNRTTQGVIMMIASFAAIVLGILILFNVISNELFFGIVLICIGLFDILSIFFVSYASTHKYVAPEKELKEDE